VPMPPGSPLEVLQYPHVHDEVRACIEQVGAYLEGLIRQSRIFESRFRL